VFFFTQPQSEFEEAAEKKGKKEKSGKVNVLGERILV